MSGAIFTPLEGLGALDAASGHPLVCPLCHAQFERPCLLDCFHDFCTGCLRGRATDGRLACPLCQHQTVVKGPSGLPPVDRLLQFLVDSSGDGSEAVHCANCDLECNKQDAETTYFCNTCGQPLCARCRDETHRARMFAHHDIVALGERSRDVLQKCSECGAPGRGPCVGGRWPGWPEPDGGRPARSPHRCSRRSAARRALHHVLHRQEVAAVHPLLPGHAGGEPSALRGPRVSLHAGLRAAGAGGAGERGRARHRHRGRGMGAPRWAEAALFPGREGPADGHPGGHRTAAGHGGGGAAQRRGGGGCHPCPLRQHADWRRRKRCCCRLCRANTKRRTKPSRSSSPTWPLCCPPCSLASKAEFLDLGYELMERLQAIVTRPQHLRPAQDSKITSDHHAEFARCLEPLLLLGPRMATGAGAGTSTLAAGSGPKVLMGPSCPSPAGRMLGSLVRKPTPHRSISTKVLLTEGEDTPFSEHCRHYEDSYRRLQAEIQNLKDQVQELHRDLTKHHSLIKAEIMGDLLHKSLQVDAQIASEYASLQGMRAVFQEIWEESYQRVANEQEIYEAQLHDLLQLKQENAYLTTITKQITPYIRSIAKVKERLEPRVLKLPTGEGLLPSIRKNPVFAVWKFTSFSFDTHLFEPSFSNFEEEGKLKCVQLYVHPSHK
ncbi:RING finger protein 207 isoform X5 [Mustela lutreola]|uniref:RING finger protein 207 isoform X5 n=1 Tax=Mustela lutreola TaxID=9666 RepID=UPI002797B81A|nr:RING finger protein 207 isoform X5 [Mustela lutreola]